MTKKLSIHLVSEHLGVLECGIEWKETTPCTFQQDKATCKDCMAALLQRLKLDKEYTAYRKNICAGCQAQLIRGVNGNGDQIHLTTRNTTVECKALNRAAWYAIRLLKT